MMDNGVAVSDAQSQGHRMRWHVLVVTQAAAFMALLDVSIVNVAIPSIQRGLHASPATVQWVVSGYALAFGLALVPAGRLGDMFGRRRMFLIGLLAFVLTSALTGAAPTTGTVLAARVLQGLAGGILMPQNSGLIQELFRGAERGRAFGIMGSTIGVATATGPIVGGLILTAFTGPEAWRWVFYVNVPVGLVALLLAMRILPATKRERPARIHLDVVGVLLLGGGILSLLLPLVNADSGGLRDMWWLFAVAVLLLVAFGAWEVRTVRRGREPLLDPRLVRLPDFAAGSTIGMVYFTGFTGVLLVLALFFQHGLGYSPLASGLAVTPFAIGTAVMSAIAGRLVASVGRMLTVYGLIASVLGLATTAIVLRHGAPWWATLPLLVAGVGGGMVVSPNITITLQNVPTSMAGAAGGVLQTAQRIGTAIGSAVLVTVFYHELSAARGAYHLAISYAILSAAAIMVVALILALKDLISHRPAPRSQPLA